MAIKYSKRFMKKLRKKIKNDLENIATQASMSASLAFNRGESYSYAYPETAAETWGHDEKLDGSHTPETFENRFDATMTKAEEFLEKLVGEDGEGGFLGVLTALIEPLVNPKDAEPDEGFSTVHVFAGPQPASPDEPDGPDSFEIFSFKMKKSPPEQDDIRPKEQHDLGYDPLWRDIRKHELLGAMLNCIKAHEPFPEKLKAEYNELVK